MRATGGGGLDVVRRGTADRSPAPSSEKVVKDEVM